MSSSERRSGARKPAPSPAVHRRGFTSREARILSLVDQGYSAGEIVEMLQAGSREGDPKRPLGGTVAGVSPEGRAAAVIVLVALLIAAIFIADLIVGGEDSPIMFLMVVPVAVLAMEFAAAGGLIGAALATALLAITAIGGNHDDLGTGAFYAQVAAFGLTAVVVGVMAGRLHVLTRELDVAQRKVGLQVLVGAVGEASRPEGSPKASSTPS
jgi:hypothetical protein